MRAGFANDEAASYRYKGRLNRAASSGDNLKGSLQTPEQRVNSMAAPAGDRETQILLGDTGRKTIAEATAVRNKAIQGKPYTQAVKDFVRMYYGNNGELKVRPSQP